MTSTSRLPSWGKGNASRLGAFLVWLVALGAATPAQAQSGSSDQGAVPSGGAGAVRVAPKAAPEPDAQPVTPPKITHFEQASYPAEAQKAGLEANVILRLDIDKDGKVTAVTVTEPAGHGFDEAATEAAKKFSFEPARRGTTPIAARIHYRYGFTLKVATPEETQAATPPPPSDSLRGTVRAADADLPLAGATIELKNDRGEATVVSTSVDGTFKFAGLLPGRYKLSLASAGFEPLVAEEEVVADTVTELVYRLKTKGAGIEVFVKGDRPPREVTRRTLEKREIERIPGTNGDALRSLQNLPGVGRPPGLAGLLIIRGSAPQDTNTFVDGTYVPLVYHFGGLSSIIPTEMLEKIDFYPGNFSAQYGRVMGGIVDVGVRSPNKDGKYHGLAQIDLIDGRLLLEGPIPLLKGWSFIVGGRRSWVDVWLKPVLTEAGAGVTAAPVYYDYQAYIETKPTSRSSFRVGVFGSDDRLELLIRDPAANDPGFGGNLALRTGFYRFQALYRNDISDNLKFSSSVSYGLDRIDFGLGTFFFRIRSPVLLNRDEISYRPFSGLTLHAGLDLAYAPYEVDVRFPPPPRPGEPSPGPFVSRPPSTLHDKDAAWRPAAYLEAEINPGYNLKVVPGLRVDYARDTGKADVSPRINARYDIHHDFPRTTVKGGVGLYYQPPQFQETSPVFGSRGLVSNRATHYSLGVEQELTRPIDVSVEGFYKDLHSLVARLPNEFGNFDYNNLGKGYVVGAEVLLKYKPDERFFGWLAYTVSRSARQNPPDYATQLFQYDQTHILTLLGSYRLGRGWEFGARFRLVSGSLYTPAVGGVFDADAGAYAQVSGAPFSRRVPFFHQLDLRVDKQWRFSSWTLRTYLDVQNVYNRSNPEGVTYNYDYSQSRVQGFLPIIPSLGVRGEF
ncbi:MAG TPA: TonB-dependent receptor [Polyangiaceae bacterium]|nr:TonB-dependent receptor [Polyangiaceae bacterium]